MTSASAQALLREHAALLLERKRRESQAWRDVSFAGVLERCDALIAAWEKAGFLSLLQADEVGAPFELLRIYLDLSAELICGVGKGSVFAKKIWDEGVIWRLHGLPRVPAAELASAVQSLHGYQVEVFNLIENLARGRSEAPWLEPVFDHFSAVFSSARTASEAVAEIEKRLDRAREFKPLSRAGTSLGWRQMDLRSELSTVAEVLGARFLRPSLIAVRALLHECAAEQKALAAYYILIDEKNNPVALGPVRLTGEGSPLAAEGSSTAALCPSVPGILAVRWAESEQISVQGRRLSARVHLGWSLA